MLDYNSLLIALSFCSIGLAFTFLLSWLVSRQDHVLLTWFIGVSFLVVSLFIYREFVERFSPFMGVGAFAAMLTGLTFFMGAGRQFTSGKLPLATIALTAVSSIVAMAVPMLLDYDGISYVAMNLASAAILFATGRDYWRWRSEAPLLILFLAVLYMLTAFSFLLCAAVLIHTGNWVMHHAPSGLVENINLGMCLTSIGSMGALSLALNQVRIARHHKRQAETDSLTGLFNRRALFERTRRLRTPVAVAIFDIDHFKRINDLHGHQVGDTVLQIFGSVLVSHLRTCDTAARLGGEEFAVVLPDVSPEDAMLIAERVRHGFAAQNFDGAAGDFACTVSAGLSHAANDSTAFPVLLRQADLALYEAKDAGRNRIVSYAERVSLAPDKEPWPAERTRSRIAPISR